MARASSRSSVTVATYLWKTAPFSPAIHSQVTWLLPFLPTGCRTYGLFMARFTVTLTDQSLEHIDHADAYQQEGPLTTFFAFSGGREVIDSWSRRLASFRTADLVVVRRLDESDLAPLLRTA